METMSEESCMEFGVFSLEMKAPRKKVGFNDRFVLHITM
jgi:hypothetical protein